MVSDIGLGGKMRHSLRTKLTLSCIFYSLFIVFIVSIFTNIFLEKYFQTYIKNQQEHRNNEIVALINQQYTGDNTWEKAVIEDIGMRALENGNILRVKDSSGNIIWDAMLHNSGLCVDMLSRIADNMESRYPNFQGGYVEEQFIISQGLVEIGLVEIGYYGPFYFNEGDLEFISSFNKALIVISLISLFFSLTIGFYISKRLSYPISNTVSAAKLIAKGFYGYRIAEKSNTTEIKQLTSTINNLAESLEKQDKIRKRMSSDITHELRTPIATLQSHLEAMIDGIWTADTQRLKNCHEEVMRIGRLIGSINNLASYEEENFLLKKKSFDLAELVLSIVRNFESDYNNKDVKLKFTGEKQIIYADRDKMSQVIVNLLSNALKYSYKGSFVEIILSDLNNNILIVVKDTGTGIPPEDLPYIFERFYRVDISRNRLTGGSGIGLSIVKSIIEAHNGSISVQSKMGLGTHFIITLPK